jgi:hypothetical protein
MKEHNQILCERYGRMVGLQQEMNLAGVDLRSEEKRGLLLGMRSGLEPAANSNLSLWMRQILLRHVSALDKFQKNWQGTQYPLPA